MRSSGNANNSGAFNPARANAGTDYSQQDANQVTYSDLVIGASNTLTSAAFPFAAAHVANHLRITGGAGFTTGVYEIISVAGTTATVDRSPGTLASSGGAGRLGGALSSPADVVSLLVAGAVAYYRGSFNLSAAVTFSVAGTDVLPITHRGYTATRTDDGLATFLCTSEAVIDMAVFSGARQIVRNLQFDADDKASAGANAGGSFVLFYGCEFLDAEQTGLFLSGTSCRAVRCRASGCSAGFTDDGNFRLTGTDSVLEYCESRDGDGHGIAVWATSAQVRSCIVTGNALDGIYLLGSNTGAKILQNTVDGNTRDGIRYDGTTVMDATWIENNLISNNGGWGQRAVNGSDYSTVTAYALKFQKNATYNNTLGIRDRVPAGTGDVALTADPYFNRAGRDFRLNLAVGGGLLARGAGLPGGFGLLGASAAVSVGLNDIGAVVLAGLAASGVGTAYGQGWARSLWRELTNERSTSVVPDSVVDLYLQRGAEALNDVVRYHRTTGTLLLTAGTQEYDLPADFIEMQFLLWNGKEVDKNDVERWRENGIDWRNEPSGAPIEWAVYAQKLVLRPTPDAAAVATASALTIRYTSTPADVTTFGFAQLGNHHARLPVYYAAALWAAAYPESQRSVLLEKGLLERFTAEAQAAAVDYGARPLR